MAHEERDGRGEAAEHKRLRATFSKTPDLTVAQMNKAWGGMADMSLPALLSAARAEGYEESAAALAEAQATIARLEAALREIAQEPMNGDLMEPIIKRNLAIARAALSHGKGGSPNHTGTVTVLNEPFTVEVGKVPERSVYAPPWVKTPDTGKSE